jgi:membrane protease YdiL (CAAX protease family)
MMTKKIEIDWELWLFLCAIVVANSAFILAVTHDILPLQLYSKGRFLLLGLVLVVVVAAFRGGPALLDLVRPMGRWRVNIGWYLLALCWAPLMCVISLLMAGVVTGDFGISLNDVLLQRPQLLLTVLIASFVGEIVWVSYAIGRLSRRTTVLEAGLIVGVFWSLWWVPIVLFGQGVIPGLPMGGLFLNMIAVAAMCGFVYAKTGSGLVVLLLQVMLNSSILLFPVLPTTGGDMVYWIFGAVYLVGTGLLYVFFGPYPLLSTVGQEKRITG